MTTQTQLITTRGLVINERSVGENDKYIELLTEDLGVIDVSVKGVKKITSKNAGSAQLFSYSKFCLSKRGERFYINSSENISIFFEIRLSIEKLSLASYFSEIVKYALPNDLPCNEVLRLFLNTLYYLCNDKLDMNILKSIFELRLLTEIGLMPQLIGCRECFCFENEYMFFDYKNSNLICKECIEKLGLSADNLEPLHPAALKSVRHVCLSDFEKIFSFSLADTYIPLLLHFSEKYLINQLGKSFKTLKFYKNIIGGING